MRRILNDPDLVVMNHIIVRPKLLVVMEEQSQERLKAFSERRYRPATLVELRTKPTKTIRLPTRPESTNGNRSNNPTGSFFL